MNVPELIIAVVFLFMFGLIVFGIALLMNRNSNEADLKLRLELKKKRIKNSSDSKRILAFTGGGLKSVSVDSGVISGICRRVKGQLTLNEILDTLMIQGREQMSDQEKVDEVLNIFYINLQTHIVSGFNIFLYTCILDE